MMRRPTADGAGKPVFTFSGAATHADSPGRGVDDDAREGSGYWEAAALNFERLCN